MPAEPEPVATEDVEAAPEESAVDKADPVPEETPAAGN